MQELDVSKPMTFENDHAYRIRFCDYITKDREMKLVLIVTSSEGNEFVITTDKFGTQWGQKTVINVPEKPAFSWDKPIRCKNPEYKYIRHENSGDPKYPKRILIETKNGERIRLSCRENGSFCFACPLDMELENYEPEYSYHILDESPNNYCVRKTRNGFIGSTLVADFREKEDAELFKSVKEQGL